MDIVFVFLLIFAPFVWFMFWALRYTNETVGENSPLNKERTYQLSAWQYFGTFYKLMLAFVFPQMLLLAKLMGNVAITQHEPLIFVMSLIFIAFAGYVVFVFYVDWQYWTITRDVAITLNPFEPNVHIDSLNETATLTPNNVTLIEQHLRESSNSKEPLYGYGYFLFYTTDGQIVRINNIFFVHVEFLEHLFATVPYTLIRHRIPWITQLNEMKSTQQPNFAPKNQR